MILTDTALFSLAVFICILQYLQLTHTHQKDVMQKISQPDALLAELQQLNMGLLRLLGKRRMADLQLRTLRRAQELQDAKERPFDSDLLRWIPGFENSEPVTIFVVSRKEGKGSRGDIPWARIHGLRPGAEDPGVFRVSNEGERTEVEQTYRNRNQCGESATGIERSDRSQQTKSEETKAKRHSSSNRKLPDSKDPGSKS